MPSSPIGIFWFRRDLRVEDNHALCEVSRSGLKVLPLFLFDSNILGKLSHSQDARVSFLYDRVVALRERFSSWGGTLVAQHGKPEEVWERLLESYPVAAVFANRDYEPYATQRDKAVEKILAKRGIPFSLYDDQVIFAPEEVLKKDGKPYLVFTPYAKKWMENLDESRCRPHEMESGRDWVLKASALPMPTLEEIGFHRGGPSVPIADISERKIRDYHLTRDFPAQETTRLGIHLRFGTLGIRELVKKAMQWNATFLKELIWREFFMQILFHFPWVEKRSFREVPLQWENREEYFSRWCEGKTGYPFVDAGMRELNATGYMHNRCRMVCASFLAKTLKIDWRWGERYFAEKLLDYELSSNNGNWQWAAGTGCDAMPYFRVFNPLLQQKKFDSDRQYVEKWVPELDEPDYIRTKIEIHSGKIVSRFPRQR